MLRASGLALIALLVSLSWAPQTTPGSLRGRVVLPEVPPSHDARPTVNALAGSTPDPVDRRHAVVYLDAVPRRAFEAVPTRRVRMDQVREQFVPRVLAITVGTVVEFPNNDVTFHNVMSLARSNAFDLGRYPRGQTRTVHFDTPGIVPIVCDIHTHMSAWVLVFSHPFFAVTDTAGRYTMAGVPPGTHTIKVWSELGQAPDRRVTVSPGAVVDADFRVERIVR